MCELHTPDVDPVITDYYDRAPEEIRLEQGPFQLEEARTRELIQRFAPPPPGIVVDVGGAAGAYALWLAEAGYSVDRVGDARALELPGDFADVILLLGPLYHLTDPGDRARSLHEVARVLKPGGWLFAAAISRWASALEGLARDLLHDRRFAAIVEQDYFTTAYFHRPEELADEVLAADLALTGVFGLEGPGWILPDVPERMADLHRRAALLGVARMLETEPAVLGSSAHILAVAQRPG